MPRRGADILNTKGFTFLEFVVIIMIIGVIGGLAVPNIFDYIESTKIADDISDADHLISLASQVYNDNPKFEITAIRQAVQEKFMGNWPKGRTSLSKGKEMELSILTDNPRKYMVTVNNITILPHELAGDPYKQDE